MDHLIVDHRGGLYLPPSMLQGAGLGPGTAVQVRCDGRFVVLTQARRLHVQTPVLAE